MLEKIFIYLLICYGITNIIVNGYIFNWLRNYLEKKEGNLFIHLAFMINCEMCIGFHAGLFIAIIENIDFISRFGINSFINFAFISSGFCWFIGKIVLFLERNTNGYIPRK
jgi:hypothetical protein